MESRVVEKGEDLEYSSSQLPNREGKSMTAFSRIYNTGAKNENRHNEILRIHSTLKCLSKCHIVISLVLLVLAALADYVSYRVNTVRFHGLAECCALYFLIVGVLGIFGSASHRRGLIIAFMIMGLHGVLIFAPIIIISSSFDIHFYNNQCWGECDWHLLSASLPKNSRCQILCGDNIDSNLKSSMSRLGTDYRLDAGLISLAILEFFLSLTTTGLCVRQIFGCSSREQPANTAGTNVELQPLNTNPEERKQT